MRSEKVHFPSSEQEQLTGRLELPVDQHPHNYALFAHCFTCSKNLNAVKQISRALTGLGYGVLRFDFTGLGESEGSFKDTNFSGNVEDLLAAAQFLEENYSTPKLLVGHSLGGAACLKAAFKLPDIQAVATVGAPANPDHVTHLFSSKLDEIEANGKAEVNIGGRSFTLKQQFVEDLRQQQLEDQLQELGKALLFMHSPQDTTVSIRNAETLYKAAKHPKSFVSLDGADHLLSNSADAEYAGKVIAQWAGRYVGLPEEPDLKTADQVVARLDIDDGFTTDMKLGKHYMLADEPRDFGGNDYGPSPYELVSAGLAACTAMTLQMYARRKKWELQHVEVHISYSKKHAEDCKACETKDSKIDTFERTVKLVGDLDDSQINKLLEIADKCPVHRTLHNEIQVKTRLTDQ
ncbi:bifunctional alpha/beta hydrolase/OsmC family protein [Robiginitalea sp. IMCC43444]|uniref:bifunctional alpha/beta hydrolase/OsmC family protein n=1 Tax=Robiginitalea sp. IMCC43444 TaxID=3459121 RepID=UPI004041E964